MLMKLATTEVEHILLSALPVTLSPLPSLLYKCLYFLFISDQLKKPTLIRLRFYIDVCPLKSNCHACVLCVLYGAFEIFILSERYICMRYKREL